MPVKHFRAVSLAPNADQQMADAIDSMVPIRFVVLWTRGVGVTLYALHVRIQGQPWQNAITSVVADNDGEITVYVGAYTSGTALEFHFGILAIDANIPKLATYVVAGSGQVAKLKPAAPDEFKSIARGETWSDNAQYSLATGAIA